MARLTELWKAVPASMPLEFTAVATTASEEHSARWVICTQVQQPQNIVIRRIPTLHDIIIMLQFFAQYTDVDGVVVLAPENRVMGMLSLMNGIVHVQTHWNMVVSIGGAERAEDVVTMITIQNEMEAEAVEGNSAIS